MGRSNEIQKKALGLDYDDFETSPIAFAYDMLMTSSGYTLEEVNRVQSLFGVGNTPLLEARNITKLARKYAKPVYGARIVIQDEAANPSGSFKDRRAACAVYHAKKLG
ncbi:MAG: PLP-dependent lyase/thiolase, partial [Firmicutes bacterium]|nr:PLP-dependent lyase/thiolase [Bacillota bacterium]